jgi:protein involved in polysaccharide export with SLBB domain
MINIFHIIIISTGLLFGQTAEQIKKAKEMIQRTGMSESQARDAAKARGYTDKQIDAAIQKEKASKTKSGESVPESAEKLGLPELGKSNEVVQEQPVLETIVPIVGEEVPIVGEELPIIGNDDLEIVGDGDLEVVDDTELDIESEAQPTRGALTYFGYDIFKRDPALFQATSVGAVDPNYLIGPGDEIIVMLWGETQFRQVLTVDREGFVFIPEIGQVFVNGLNLNLLESKLFRVFSQSYASLNPQNRMPTTFLDVSLSNLRPLRIQVLGEVAQPGAYTVSPSATLFSSLYYFNGPTTLGSLRDIQLIRGGKKIASIDFYDYLLTGKKPKDQKLQLDDVIFIPRRLKTVTIEGEINRSGIYELKPEESLSDLITMAGDLKITAYLDRSQIDRIVPFEDRAELGMDRMYTDVNLEQVLKSEDGFPLQDGDRIQIFSVLDLRQNVVVLRGAVTRPGSYDLGESLKLSELINKADGLLGDAYLERVDVVRIKPDFTEELIKLDLEKALAGNTDHNIQLQGLDRVRVYSMTEMVPRTYVSITGHAKRPGRFLLQENMTLYDLIFKAGGYVDEEYKKLTYLKRAELVRVREDSDEKEIIPFNLGLVLNKQGLANTALRTDDAVRIYSVNEIEGETRYVSISGHVKRPGQYELFEGNMTLYDLIFKAGGFEDEEFKKRTYLKRAELVRVNEDNDEKEIIPFNLGLVLNKQRLANTALRTDDAVRIYSVNEIEGETRYVSINGHVKRPGQYELFEGNMTLYDLIFKAGGFVDEEFKKRTYLKRAELVRIRKDSDEKEIIPFNLGLVLNKQGLANTALRIDDNIIVYSVTEIEGITGSVTISGNVKNPGIYELFEMNMRIYDLLFKAGGFDDPQFKASIFLDRADLIRYNEDRITQSIIPFNLDSVLSDKSNKQNIILLPGDEIKVYSETVFNAVQAVSINGVVRNPGTYDLKTGMTFKDLMLEAGGLIENVHSYRVEVARIDPLNKNLDEYAEVITFNMDEKFNVSTASSYYDSKKRFLNTAGVFQLKPYDLVSIRPDPYFSNQRKVTISGEVLYPGDYTIINSNEKITNIIERAGGLLSNAYADASQYTRQGVKINASLGVIIKNPRSKLNFVVQDGDEIMIVPHPNVIMITGEVNTSGIHKYVPGKRLRYYLKLAGGINPDADKTNIWVAYPSGDSKKYKSWSLLSPKIIDGSSIMVGKQKEAEPFDRTEFAKEVTAILANLAQVMAVVVLARK